MEDIILYHGSRGGLEGNIRPISRERCDFGKGFYMGTNPIQVKELITDEITPVFYTLKLKLSEIPENKILVLENKDWLYTILANRKFCQEFNELKIAKQWLNKIDKYDVVIGPIADNKMKEAIAAFSKGYINDENLIARLQHFDYGTQYVIKTEYACSKIEILSAERISEKEIQEIERNGKKAFRKDSAEIKEDNFRFYNYEGKYLKEIIQEEVEKEKRGRNEISR